MKISFITIKPESVFVIQGRDELIIQFEFR